jgi:hypothetical protein
MLMLTPKQIEIVRHITKAITDTVFDAEPLGVPGSVIYAALVEQGCNFQQYESIMSRLVGNGLLTRDGDIYHIARGTIQ